MALDSKLVERGNEALVSEREPLRRLMIARQYLLFALALIVVGAGLVGWVAYGSGPPKVLFFALILLGMGAIWLGSAVLFSPSSSQVRGSVGAVAGSRVGGSRSR